jgi:hypothetical protein
MPSKGRSGLDAELAFMHRVHAMFHHSKLILAAKHEDLFEPLYFS